nr:hypothetical protein [Caldilineaceae bacterium]
AEGALFWRTAANSLLQCVQGGDAFLSSPGNQSWWLVALLRVVVTGEHPGQLAGCKGLRTT